MMSNDQLCVPFDGTSPPVLDKSEVENLRLCRKRAYHKFNVKRRQHVHTSLASLFLKEWQILYPESLLTGRELLMFYTKYCENKNVNGSIPNKDGSDIVESNSRDEFIEHDELEELGQPDSNNHHVVHDEVAPDDQTGPGSFADPNENICEVTMKPSAMNDNGPRPGVLNTPIISIHKKFVTLGPKSISAPVPLETSRKRPHSETEIAPLTLENHSDKQWSDSMLHNLYKCRKIAENRHNENPKIDLADAMHAEWMKLYPNSVLTQRNLKSRYAVSQNTFHELPPSLKKRFLGIAEPNSILSNKTTRPSAPSANQKPSITLAKPSFNITYRVPNQKVIRSQIPTASQKVTQAIEKVVVSAPPKVRVEPPTIIKLPTFPVIQKPSQTISVLKPLTVPPVTLTIKNVSLANPSKNSQNAKIFVSSYAVKAATVPGHPTNVHIVKRDLTSGAISTIELPTAPVLTTLPPAVPAKEINENSSQSPQTNRQRRTCQTHRIHVFESREKTVSCKLTQRLLECRERLREKFPEDDLDKLKKPKGFAQALYQEWVRISPEPDFTSIELGSKLGKYDRINVACSVAESKITTIPNPEVSDDTNSPKFRAPSPDRVQQQLEKSPSPGIKGFRSWDDQMSSDLLSAKKFIMKSRPDLEVGSSDFNRSLLQQFTKTFPKCMESSRSIFARLQSIEKDDTSKAIKNGLEKQSSFVCQSLADGIDSSASLQHPRDHPDETETDDCEIIVESISFPKLVQESDSRKSPAKRKLDMSTAGSGPSTMKKPMLTRRESIFMQSLVGFGDWTPTLIRDLYRCMVKASAKRDQKQKKSVKYKDNVKLKHLLMSYWKQLYPNSKETQESLDARVMHLLRQRSVITDYIKKLRVSEGASSADAGGKELSNMSLSFRWEVSMTNDLVSSFKKASSFKRETSGQKYTLWFLWEREFKKLYVKAPYSGKNLAVIFWAWCKKQNPPQIDKNMYSVVKEEPEEAKKKKISSLGTWSRTEKIRLLIIGQQVEAMLRDPSTPNDLKLQGFATMLVNEWLLANPNLKMDPAVYFSFFSRSLNCTYSKVVRYGIEEELNRLDDYLAPGWTYECQDVLFQVGEEVQRALNDPEASKFLKSRCFDALLIQYWKNLPHSKTVSDCNESIIKLYKKVVQKRKVLQIQQLKETSELTFNHCQDLLLWMEKHAETAFTQGLHVYKRDVVKSWRLDYPNCLITEEKIIAKIYDIVLADVTAKFNADGDNMKDELPFISCEFVWDEYSCDCLLRCYKSVLDNSRLYEGSIQEELRYKFVARFPLCQLSASVLYSKLFLLKIIQNLKICTSQRMYRGSWTNQMVHDLIYTRSVAMDQGKHEPSDIPKSSISNVWYTEFRRLHPNFRGNKQDLWDKFHDHLNQCEDAQQSTKSKNNPDVEIKEEHTSKVFHRFLGLSPKIINYIKSSIETNKIYIPTRVAQLVQEPQAQAKGPGKNMTTNTGTRPRDKESTKSESSSTPKPSAPTVISIAPKLPLNQLHGNGASHYGIILPGGAVASPVSDPEAIKKLKEAKRLEKPEVTLSLLNFKNPNISNLNPTPPSNVEIPDSVVTQELMDKFHTKLRELKLDNKVLGIIMQIYEEAREEFKNIHRKGYLVYFPHLLSFGLKKRLPEVAKRVSGEELYSLMSLYVEARKSIRFMGEEFLAKLPGKFKVTEWLLTQVLLVFEEIEKLLEGKMKSEIPSAVIYLELVKRWQKIFPQRPMSPKHLVSIHNILTYEEGKNPDPEVQFLLMEVWQQMDTQMPLASLFSKQKLTKKRPAKVVYDIENVTFEQVRSWMLSTENLPRETLKNSIHRRKTRCLKKFKLGLNKALLNVVRASQQECKLKISRKKKADFLRILQHRWKKSSPSVEISAEELLARYLQLLRSHKNKIFATSQREVRRQEAECIQICSKEVETKVIFEGVRPKYEEFGFHDDQDEKLDLSLATTTSKSNQTDTNFYDDENVLAYIGELQKRSKSCHLITWTPNIIRDLLKARSEARRKKRTWEKWALQKYGSVAVAYNKPGSNFKRLNTLFKEEWAKLRPQSAGLSIITLVTYARKYDNLKRGLISKSSLLAPVQDECHGAEKICFFKNSSVPVFNLEKLSKLKGIPKEMRDLLSTRQLAKEQAMETPQFMLPFLWQNEWEKINPDSDLTGYELQIKLCNFEKNNSFLAHLQRAYANNTDGCYSDKSYPNDDDDLLYKPRDNIFPESCEGEPLRVRVSSCKTGPTVNRVILHRLPYECGTSFLPIVKVQSSKKLPKRYEAPSIRSKDTVLTPVVANVKVDPVQGKFACQFCDESYSDLTDLVFHQKNHPSFLEKENSISKQDIF